MRIGELSERSGASARSIRYYESVGLLTSRRRTNGYREFDADALEQITKIKLLLQVGLEMDLASGLAWESQLFAGLFATDDRRAGMESFVEHGPGKAQFEGR